MGELLSLSNPTKIAPSGTALLSVFARSAVGHNSILEGTASAFKVNWFAGLSFSWFGSPVGGAPFFKKLMNPLICTLPLTSNIIFGPVSCVAVIKESFIRLSIKLYPVGTPPIWTCLSSVIYIIALSVFWDVSVSDINLLENIPTPLASVLGSNFLTLLKFVTYPNPLNSCPFLSGWSSSFLFTSWSAIDDNFPGVRPFVVSIFPNDFGWCPLSELSPKDNLLNGVSVPIPTTWGKSIL